MRYGLVSHGEDRQKRLTVSVSPTPEIATASRGTGLGLPIVKGQVDMHSGRVA